jgi:hypothetical protein
MAQQSLPYNQQLGLPKSNVPWRAGHAAGKLRFGLCFTIIFLLFKLAHFFFF